MSLRKTMFEEIAQKAMQQKRCGDAAKAILAANNINPKDVLVDEAWNDVLMVEKDQEYVTIQAGDLRIYVNIRRLRMWAEWIDTKEVLPTQDLSSCNVSFPAGSWIDSELKNMQLKTPAYAAYSEFD